jgi:hypothetical protein
MFESSWGGMFIFEYVFDFLWVCLKVCLFDSGSSIVFLSLFKSKFGILNLDLSLSLDVQLRFKKLWRFVSICLSVSYLKWMSNIYPLSIMFYYVLYSNFEFELVCHMYIICPLCLSFGVICMSNVYCVCLHNVFNF